MYIYLLTLFIYIIGNDSNCTDNDNGNDNDIDIHNKHKNENGNDNDNHNDNHNDKKALTVTLVITMTIILTLTMKMTITLPLTMKKKITMKMAMTMTMSMPMKSDYEDDKDNDNGNASLRAGALVVWVGIAGNHELMKLARRMGRGKVSLHMGIDFLIPPLVRCQVGISHVSNNYPIERSSYHICQNMTTHWTWRFSRRIVKLLHGRRRNPEESCEEKCESCGARMTKRGINLYIELQKRKLDQIAARNKNVPRQTYSFLEVKLRRLRRKMYENKHDIRDKNLPTVLANSSNHSRTRRHN